jgi:predicted secreted Zn-dependent protease
MRRLALLAALTLLGCMLAPRVVAVEGLIPSVPMPELTRRLTSDVPRFVGPASLKLHGTTGAYRWDEVHYGADQLAARVATVGGEIPCVVRLRLVEGDERVYERGFPGESVAKSVHEAVVGVDYATARLRVDSTCAAWSLHFTPLEDPELPYTISERYYTVRGDSVDRLATQTQRIKGRWAAWTEWFTSWQYWFDEAGASCDVTHGATDLQATVIYPVWRQPADVDSGVTATWERFIENLRAHELGHVTIALQGAHAIGDRLDAGFSAPTCDEAAAAADGTAHRILERYDRRSARYDRETSHGLTQGTGLR